MLSRPEFINRSKKFKSSLDNENLISLFKELESISVYARNKSLIKVIRQYLNLSQQETYEYLAQISGEKNWNIAKAKKLDFTLLFTDEVRKIPLGYDEIDATLHGGLPRQGLSVLAAPAGVGKSMFCVSIGANALKQGFKVLHITLEWLGQSVSAKTNKDFSVAQAQSLFRYSSNLNQLHYSTIMKDNFSPEEIENKYLRKYSSELKVISLYRADINNFEAEIIKIKKDFNFDLIVIDDCYSFENSNNPQGLDLVVSILHQIAIKQDCVVISPAHLNRKADVNSFSLNDLSVSMKISHTASVIIGLRRLKENSLQAIILKNRGPGITRKWIDLNADYNLSNLLIKN